MFTCLHLPSLAIQIEKINGKSVLIDTQGESVNIGDIFYSLDDTGKKRGLIKISKIGRGKAIGKLGKGKAEPGWMLELKPPSTKAQTPRKPVQPKASSSALAQSASSQRSYWGFMLGAIQDNVSVDLVDDSTGLATGESVGLTGITYAAKGFFDYKIFDGIWFRGATGVESLDASGKRTNGESRSATIMYMSFDFWGRYVFSEDSLRPWLGGGFNLMFPLSKSATALEESSITNTSTMAVGGGVDWFLNPESFIPLSIEYGLFPEAELVSANYIAFRFGYGMTF